MKKKIWIIIAIVGLVTLMALRLAGNKRKIEEKKKTTTETNVEIPVNVVAVAFGSINENLVKTAVLIPYKEADISATTSGTLQTVNFSLGSKVGEGQVVAQIDNTLLNLKLEAAKLQQRKLQKDYDRFVTLLKGEATTEVNLQDVKYNLDNVGNQINQIEKQIADNLIKAPVSGQIVVKNVEAGEFVSPGKVIGKAVDVSRLKVDMQVSEADAYKVNVGDKVNITTDLYPNQTFAGKVIFVSQQGDAAHNYQVQIELPNTSSHPLKAGTFVYATFIQNDTHSALQIPRGALVESMKNPYVYVVQNGKAITRKIKIGKELGENIEVIEGLTQGEQVIVNGQINLTDSSAVRIVK